MEEKEIYMAPEVKVVALELEGIIAASGEFDGEGDAWGGSMEW